MQEQVDQITLSSETEPPTALPLVDWKEFDTLVGGFPKESVGKMMEVLCGELFERAELIRSANIDKDREQLEMQSHTLKSVAGQYGAERLQTVSTRLNELCKDGYYQQAFRLALPLTILITETICEYRTYLPERGE
jgi:HPt (histidine-containing phosphotransfer) domain-containing protein